MRKGNRPIKILSALVVLAFLAAFAVSASPAAPAKTPAKVAGTWKVSGTGDAGVFEQTVVFTQNAEVLTGKFTAAHQAGTVEGVLDGTAIKFSARGTGVYVQYTGDVTADTMRGTLISQGKNGTWTARFTKPE